VKNVAVKIEPGCIGCGACVGECPFEALYIGDDGLCHVIEEKCTSCGKCVEVCPVNVLHLPLDAAVKPAVAEAAPPPSKEKMVEKPAAKLGAMPSNLALYKGIWVFIEQREGQIMPVSLELLGAGRPLADKLGVELCGVLLGDRVLGLENKLYEYGADKVYLVDDPALHYYRTETYSRIFVNLVKEHLPDIVLMGATTTGRDFAGAVATEINTGLTADCTGLDVDLEQHLLLATRPAFGGNIMATIITKFHRPQMATVRPKVMKMSRPQPGREGVLIRPEVEIKEDEIATKVLKIVREEGEIINLQDAEYIVSGGRGLGDPEGFKKIVNGLADAIGAQVGGSRAAVEAGWVVPKRQVGQTGTTVAPKIYFALGISGAIQHLVGIKGSDIIVAINTDPNAPIFKECTFGIVGDVYKIVPLLTEPLKELLDRKRAELAVQLSSEGGKTSA
jgi:electron transfer flavoprotein alpha subunit